MPIWRSRIVEVAEAEDGTAVLAGLHDGISDSPQKAASTFLGNVLGEAARLAKGSGQTGSGTRTRQDRGAPRQSWACCRLLRAVRRLAGISAISPRRAALTALESGKYARTS
jgi:hypothetical protein